MTLPTPRLDDRKFQDIVDEARRLIPRYCPEWTDHNLSDPGITLIELFAWMTESIIFRLNQIPERMFVEFLNLLGVSLEPASPAIAEVTFRLTAPQPRPTVIPAGTEVATVRTDTEEAITFATIRDTTILVPSLRRVTSGKEENYLDQLQSRSRGRGVRVFDESPKVGNAFWLEFNENLAGHTLAIQLNCSIEGIGVNPDDPPLLWEYWSPDTEDASKGNWLKCRLHEDSTGGLNRPGVVILDIPLNAGPWASSGGEGTWLSCRIIEARHGQPSYRTSPLLHRISVDAIGGTVPAEHSTTITNEILGRSDGTRGQILHLNSTPILAHADRPLEMIVGPVLAEGANPAKWHQVADFVRSQPTDRHFVIDSANGEIQFGPVVRGPDGTEEAHGAVPPEGHRLVVPRYRSGGGLRGNVGDQTITVIKSSIPYLAWVTNYEPANGGREAETLEHAKLRARREVRAGHTAVTAADFERLAVLASKKVARACCVTPEGSEVRDGNPPAGSVRILLVPALEPPSGPRDPDTLKLGDITLERVRTFLDERRLLGTQLEVGLPSYIPLRLEVTFGSRQSWTDEQASAEVEAAIVSYLDPVIGGPEGTGWKFGASLSRAELVARIQQLDCVEFLEELTLLLQDNDANFTVSRTRVTPPKGGVFLVQEVEATVETE